MFEKKQYVADMRDEARRGLVIRISARTYVVRDTRRGMPGSYISIPHDQARTLCESEIEQYNSQPLISDPLPQEIFKMQVDIQATWDGDTRRSRKDFYASQL